MRILVTGGAGFIGSHLVDRLIKEGNEVIVIDNLSSGKKENIQAHFSNPNFKFYQLDLVKDEISYCFKNIDEVWHLAANSDVRSGLKNTRIDIEQNILATYNVLEAMRKNNVRKIFFTSSSTVYGEAKVIPTPENHSTLIPISLYGASKLACEALISTYCHMFDMKALIFRIANVIGPRMTHGVIYDFINKLRKNPNELEILGNGNQKKSYIYIDDCIDAMILIAKKCNSNFEIFNIGLEDWIEVRKIAEIICKNLGLNPNFKFTGGERGWSGDVSLMLLDISKAKSFGWHPKTKIIDAIEKTIYDIRKAENIW